MSHDLPRRRELSPDRRPERSRRSRSTGRDERRPPSRPDERQRPADSDSSRQMRPAERRERQNQQSDRRHDNDARPPSDRHGCERNGHSSRRSRIRERDGRSSRQDPAERGRFGDRDGRQLEPRRDAGRAPPTAKPKAEPDWEAVIVGYDQMTAAMRLRARTRYQLRQATKKVTQLSCHS